MAYEVRVPQLTQTMSEATIARWLKREGETVEAGEALLEVVTDKATLEVESPAGGVVGKILVPEGEAPVGTVLALLLEPGEKIPVEMVATPITTGSARLPVPSTAAAAPSTKTATSGRLRVSPLARRIAQEQGVDLSQVAATGPGGLITEGDVRRYLESRQLQPATAAATVSPAPGEGTVNVAPARPPAPHVETRHVASLQNVDDEEVIPLVGVRKTIAERLSLSRRTAADVTTVAEVDMGEIAALRDHLDFTYTAFVARAVAMALTEFPILNSRLEESRIVVNKRVHLGVAIAIDEGLKVPVIRDASTRSLRQIAMELAELAQLGAGGKLTPEQLSGSTFTITNSGVFGSLLFTPIINPPESAILGMGKIAKTPVVRDDQIVIRPMMYLCLSYDHRVIDGSPAVKFLQRVKMLLETPKLLL